MESGISVDGTLRELRRLVYSDPRNFFDEHGNLLEIKELSDDAAACLASVEVVEEFAGKGADRQHVGYVKKVKFWDKNSAIEKAMKHLGLFERDNAQLTPVLPPTLVIVPVRAK